MDVLSEKTCAEFCTLIERRCSGECVAYITGKKEFRGLEFEVNPSVLVPRPDTETLVEAALEIMQEYLPRTTTNHHLLDLCTGSGAVAIALKHEMPKLEVHASDICASALKIAKDNAARLLPGNNIQFFHGDLYKALSKSLFSLIVSNPPYIPSSKIKTLPDEVQFEPRFALDGGDTGLNIIERIIDGAPDYLQPGGFLLMEADPDQMFDITILLEQRGFFDIKLFKDLSGSQRVIGGMFEK
jgi:release factor glutamine methyltransferase